jgi:hypothetical protein
MRIIRYESLQENRVRIVEANLIDYQYKRSDDNDFYGVALRLSVIGFIRPEWKFSSLDELIAKINDDLRIVKRFHEKIQQENSDVYETFHQLVEVGETFLNHPFNINDLKSSYRDADIYSIDYGNYTFWQTVSIK